MNRFYKETDGIYRLKIPFKNIYTSVFLIVTDEGAALADCGTTPYDVDNFIIPSLSAQGYKITDLKMLVITHKHSDHSGGLDRIKEIAPEIEIVTEIRQIFNKVSTYLLTGHTDDMIGILDERTGTLISGDGLQGAGVDKYRCYTKDPEAYLDTLKIIEQDERVENILFSHAYEPWNKDNILGRENVKSCIKICESYVKE